LLGVVRRAGGSVPDLVSMRETGRIGSVARALEYILTEQ